MVGPFEWTPRHVGHECMFMIVSATGDESTSTTSTRATRFPSGVSCRTTTTSVSATSLRCRGGTTGLADEFSDLTFTAKNPLTYAAGVQLEHTLPALLIERGWSLSFTNPGGAAFRLEPGETREITMHLERGADFDAKEVEGVEDRSITVAARVGGFLVGGMTYALDPAIERPNRPGGTGDHGHENPPHGHPGHRHDEHCDHDDDRRTDRLADMLLRSLERRPQRVRDVDIKKVIVEIELEDDDC